MKTTRLPNLFVLLLVFTIILTPACFTSSNPETVINLRLNSFALVLSPLKIVDVQSLSVASLLYAPLVSVDINGTIDSRLAQDVVRIDKNTLEFHLKRGVTFSNGTPVLAADVVSSICAAMQPSSPWAWALESIRHEIDSENNNVICTGVTAKDDYTVQIIEDEPVDWLLHALDGPPGWIVPSKVKEGAYGVLPSSGPYTLGKVVSDVSVELIPRKDGTAISPKADKIIFKYIPDPGQAAQMFMNGEIDVLNLNSPLLIDLIIDPENSKKIKNSIGYSIRAESEQIRVVILNENSLSSKGLTQEQIKCFKDLLNTNIDRQKIVHLSRGLLDEPIYSAYPFYYQNIDDMDICPLERAQKLPNFRVTIITESDPFSDSIAQIIKNSRLEKVTLDYQAIDKGLLIQRLVNKNYDLASILIDGNIKSPKYWASFFTPGSPFTVFGKSLPELKNMNPEYPNNLIKIGKIINQDGNWIAIVKERRILAVNSKISGLRLTPSGQPRYENISTK